LAAHDLPGRRVRDRAPTRQVRLSLDGATWVTTMGRAEEKDLRRRLAPFIRAARAVPEHPLGEAGSHAPVLSDRLREARVSALLGETVDVPENAPALERLVATTAALYAKSLADQTRRTYARRWLQFVAWCDGHELRALPAEPSTLMLFLTDMIARSPQPSLSTLRGWCNAVNRIHLEHDVAAPGDDPVVGMMMRALSHAVPPAEPVDPISALRVEDLRAVCRHLDHPDALIVRDAAIIKLVLAGVPNGIIARLRWADSRFDRDRVLLGERHNKNASVTSWRIVPALDDQSRCPVAALLRWRAIAGPNPPLVFTITDRQGRRDVRSLRPAGIAHVLASRLDSLGPQHGGVPDLATVAPLLQEVATDVLRDRAILLVGFAMAARRGELTRLRWRDVRTVDEGLILRITRSKTDLSGRGTNVGIPWGRSSLTCPVRALDAWRQRVTGQLGQEFDTQLPVFIKVGRAGRIVADQPLTYEAVTMIVKRRLQAAGIEGHWGGRSLRAGLISSCADLDLPLELIARQSRHASLDSLVKYVRAEDPFRRNAVDRVGL
jgi:integrase